MKKQVHSALDRPTDGLEPLHQKVLATIRERGWQEIHVTDSEGSTPAFSYTVGFRANLNFPEIIVFEDQTDLAAIVLANLWDLIEAGRPPPIGERFAGLYEGYDAFLKPVLLRHYIEYLGLNGWFYDSIEFPCLQLFWPDQENRFPWEPYFEPGLLAPQPDLTRRVS